MPPMQSRHRWPTTQTRLPRARIGCTQWSRPTAFAASTAAPTPAATPPRRCAQIEGLIADGRAPAAFIAEPVYGNAGGMALPDRYLEHVYAAVRAGGGLAIADEVQVAYGRLGNWFWGFQQQDVVPDIVSVAKSTGNGSPLGAVITSRDDRRAVLQTQGYFFSSTGGSPLSCAIGITVLDVLRDEGLQENAAEVGAHLKAEIARAAGQTPDHRHRARYRAVSGRRAGPRPETALNRPSRRPRRSATACSNSVWSSSRPAIT